MNETARPDRFQHASSRPKNRPPDMHSRAYPGSTLIRLAIHIGATMIKAKTKR